MKRSLFLCGLSAVSLAFAAVVGRRDQPGTPATKAQTASGPPTPTLRTEQLPSIGRVVHFVLPDGQHRPAIITDDLTGRAHGVKPVALTVFGSLLDRWEKDTIVKCPVHYDSGGSPGSWHWPEPVAPATVEIKPVTIEYLATQLHEAGREAVEKNLIVRTDLPTKGFIEWDDLTEEAREGRRVQARYLLKHFSITQ